MGWPLVIDRKWWSVTRSRVKQWIHPGNPPDPISPNHELRRRSTTLQVYESASSLNQGLNLLSLYKVDYACWQVLKYSGGVYQGRSAASLSTSLSHTHTQTHTHTHTHKNEGNYSLLPPLARCCASQIKLTSLNLFQGLSLLYWATVLSHLSLLLPETADSPLSKRATTGSRKKNIFWKQRQRDTKTTEKGGMLDGAEGRRHERWGGGGDVGKCQRSGMKWDRALFLQDAELSLRGASEVRMSQWRVQKRVWWVRTVLFF